MIAMQGEVVAAELETWLCDGAELALLDVREAGQIGEGHILFSAPAPYSSFEHTVCRIAPNPAVRMVLYDDGDGVAGRAAARAAALGYANVHVLAGGAAAWAAEGRVLFKGVNVPSKAFGELVEHACETPRLSAEDIATRRAAGAPMVMIDGRPAEEYHRMTIPGALSCPNGELALRIGALAPDPSVPVIINCAGRTRSIIGAQTLRDIGVPNPVYALENGTQGWTLAGFDLDHGAVPQLAAPEVDLAARRVRTDALAAEHGVANITADDLAAWWAEQDRTTFLLDVRTVDERAADPAPVAEALAAAGVQHAPGGQLIQATDQWIGVRNARLVLLDAGDVRAPVVAAWLARLGHDAVVLQGGVAALAAAKLAPRDPAPRDLAPRDADPALPAIGAKELARHLADGARVLDLRSSAAFRKGHVPGSRWSIRPRIGEAAADGPCYLIADSAGVAELAARDLGDVGATPIACLDGGFAAWQAAGLPVETSADMPADAERIDFLFFVHDRHDGNEEAARAYLAWETGLIAQLDPRERAVFRI